MTGSRVPNIADDETSGLPVVQVLRNDLNDGVQLAFADAESYDVGVDPGEVDVRLVAVDGTEPRGYPQH